MYSREPVFLTRDVEAVMIPHGHTVTLPKDTEVNVAQALGGSFTVYVAGNLARVAGKDADALGLEQARPPSVPADATDAELEDVLWQQMKTCYDPEIPINIVDLGLVYECRLSTREDGRKKVEIKDPQQVTMKNGRPAIQGTCPDCGTKIFKIGKLEG